MHYLTLLLLITFTLAADDTLLQISTKSTCIRDVVSLFVGSRNCSSLDDNSKSKLALKMSQCLLIQMGKSLPQKCLQFPSKDCKLEGDVWNTFSTFFAHIDNLCHFYWEMLHHEQAQLLIGKLSESSNNAQQILLQNVAQTRKIITLQHQMHSAIDQSLQKQQKMQNLIQASSKHISNITIQIETFVKRIHSDIDNNYSSLRSILMVINQALSQLLSIQSYMIAQITSVQGIIFFLCQFFAILFMGSFKKYAESRNKCLMLMLGNITLQFCIGNIIDSFLGIKILRYIFIALELVTVGTIQVKSHQLQNIMIDHFNTPRLTRMFRRAMDQNQYYFYAKHQQSSLPYFISNNIQSEKQNQIIADSNYQ